MLSFRVLRVQQFMQLGMVSGLLRVESLKVQKLSVLNPETGPSMTVDSLEMDHSLILLSQMEMAQNQLVPQ